MAKTKPTISLEGSNLHNIFNTSDSLEEGGAWVPVNDILGMKIKVRRMNSDAVLKSRERIMTEFFQDEANHDPDSIGEEESKRLLILQLADSVLIDWKGLKTASKEPIPYSKEAAIEFLKMKDFREFVYQAANDRETFRQKADEEAEKN